MALSEPVPSDVPEAEIRIPTDWLMAGLDLETVRQAQRTDSRATLTGDFLTISGLEVIVERRWLREAFWRQVKQAIGHGYVYKGTAVQVTLRADRRGRERHR
jgi:hypothetical protein